MSELFIKGEQKVDQQAVQNNEDNAAIENGTECIAENRIGAETKKKFQITKKNLIIIGVVLLVVIALACIVFHKSEFEKTRDGVVDIAGMVTGRGDYFTIETYPDTYKDMDATMRAILLPGAQQNALEAIKYANEELGFNGSLYSKMMETSALMGRQSEENDKYKVSWTYHPDDGLKVTYEKK